jgi:hypothetical protein
VRSEKLGDQSFCGIRNAVSPMVQTIVVYPSRNTLGISLFSDIRGSRNVEIVSTQKSLDPTKDKRLPPNSIHIANLLRLCP